MSGLEFGLAVRLSTGSTALRRESAAVGVHRGRSVR